MTPTITVDDKVVMVRFGTNGIPESVRTRLRTLLPAVTRQFGREVDARLASGLKSRNTLKTEIHIVEDTSNGVRGRVRVTYQGGDKTKVMLPRWLETGTRPHVIAAKNARALYFYWEKIGAYFIGPKVNHPGFAGIHYMEQATEAMRETIVNQIVQAAVEGMRQ
jgi:hypothetical protein